MELTCRACRKHFQDTENTGRTKYCPSCRKKVSLLRRQTRNDERRAAKRRCAALNPGSAHGLDLDTVLRELAQFNALRRAAGHSSISYGRYVAMRDRYIQVGGPVSGPTAVRQENATASPILPQRLLRSSIR